MFFKKSVIPLFLILVLCACFYDVVFLGKTFKATTTIAQALPYGPYGQKDNAPPHRTFTVLDAPILEETLYHFLKNNFLETNYLFRTVFLSAGEHQVRFVFRPMSFYAGGAHRDDHCFLNSCWVMELGHEGEERNHRSLKVIALKLK